jgi:hypothetical protein
MHLGLLASWFIHSGSFDLRSLTQSFIRVLLPALLSPRQAGKGFAAAKLTAKDYDKFTRQWLVERELSTLGFRRNARQARTAAPRRTSRDRPSSKATAG